MGQESLLNELWQSSLARLGGEAVIESSARELGAFQRARALVAQPICCGSSSIQAIVELIGATTTKTGLKVRAELDQTFIPRVSR